MVNTSGNTTRFRTSRFQWTTPISHGQHPSRGVIWVCHLRTFLMPMETILILSSIWPWYHHLRPWRRVFSQRTGFFNSINWEAVSKELRVALPHYTNQEIRRYADLISQRPQIEHGKARSTSFRKIFAILVLVGKTKTIPVCIREGVSDE